MMKRSDRDQLVLCPVRPCTSRTACTLMTSCVQVCVALTCSAAFARPNKLSGSPPLSRFVLDVVPLPPVIFLQHVCSCNNKLIPNKPDSMRS